MKPEHVIAFLFAEMGTTGSVDGAGRLVIKGRFQQKQIENVLRRYLGISFNKLSSAALCLLVNSVEYVSCKTCKSPDTLLTKENRIFFMACESCGSRRSVNPIKTGFQAQVGKRAKNKTGWRSIIVLCTPITSSLFISQDYCCNLFKIDGS